MIGKVAGTTMRHATLAALVAAMGAMSFGSVPFACAQAANKSGTSASTSTSKSDSKSKADAKADAKANAKAEARIGTTRSATDDDLPRTFDTRAFSLGGSMMVYESDDNGKKVYVEVRDGEVTKAQIDGKDVPADRIEKDGETIRLKGADGKVVFEHKFEGLGTAHVYQLGAVPRAWLRAEGLGGAASLLTVPPVEPPKVMIGVTMVEPDRSILGHLGLVEGKATMISSVYEGLPASKAGLEPYDIITAVEGKEPAGQDAVRKALREKNPGDKFAVAVIHQGAKHTVTITLEGYDAEKFKSAKVKAISATDAGAANPFAHETQGYLAAIEKLSATDPAIVGRMNGGNMWFRSAENEELAQRLREEAEQVRERVQEEVQRLQEHYGKVDFEEQMAQMREQMKKMQEMLEKLLNDRKEVPKEEGQPGKSS